MLTRGFLGIAFAMIALLAMAGCAGQDEDELQAQVRGQATKIARLEARLTPTLAPPPTPVPPATPVPPPTPVSPAALDPMPPTRTGSSFFRVATIDVESVRAESIEISSPDGKGTIVLAAGPDGPTIRVCDDNEMPRIVMALKENGDPSVTLNDRDGKQRFKADVTNPSGDKATSISNLQSDSVHAQSLLVQGEQAGNSAAIGLTPEGEPVIHVFDADHKLIGRVYLAVDGKPGLTIADANNRTLWSAP